MRCKISQIYLEKLKVKVVDFHLWVVNAISCLGTFAFTVSFLLSGSQYLPKATQSSTALNLSLSIPRPRATEYHLFTTYCSKRVTRQSCDMLAVEGMSTIWCLYHGIKDGMESLYFAVVKSLYRLKVLKYSFGVLHSSFLGEITGFKVDVWTLKVKRDE